MDKKEIAKFIGKDLKTLYNWERQNPNLYKIIISYFSDDTTNSYERELLQKFRQLKEIEKRYYLSSMETKILKRKIEKEEANDE